MRDMELKIARAFILAMGNKHIMPYEKFVNATLAKYSADPAVLVALIADPDHYDKVFSLIEDCDIEKITRGYLTIENWGLIINGEHKNIVMVRNLRKPVPEQLATITKIH